MDRVEEFLARVRPLVESGRLQEAMIACEVAATCGSGEQSAQLLQELGERLAQAGRHDDAITVFDQALGLESGSSLTHFARANSLLTLGRLEQAADGYRRVMQQAPNAPEPYNNLGSALLLMGRPREAIPHLEQAIARLDDYGDAHGNLGVARLRSGDVAGAVASLTRAVSLKPGSATHQRWLGNALLEAGRSAEGEAALRRAIGLGGAGADTHNDLGIALLSGGRPFEAAAAFEHALRLDPALAEAEANLGEALRCQGRPADSLPHFRRALELAPHLGAASLGLGLALLDLKEPAAALAASTRAAVLDPGLVPAQIVRARSLEQLGERARAIAELTGYVAAHAETRADAQYELAALLHRDGQVHAAITRYDRALALDPRFAAACLGRAQALESERRLPEAAEGFRLAVNLRPDDSRGHAGLLSCAVRMCDWANATPMLEHLRHAGNGLEAITPLLLLAVSDESGELLRASRARAGLIPSLPAAEARARTGSRSSAVTPIRVAYLSADFRAHPTAYLIAELLERHTRPQFTVYGFSWGSDDGSEIRTRVRRACDHFVDVERQSDGTVADWIRREQIDIAVDLNGYIEGARPGILASRPATVQVSYLGFPGTLAADHIDYVLADEFVIPERQRPFYREAIAYLPDSYQVNDRQRPLPEATAPPRDVYGLPRLGTVFCCFNNSWKITAPVFDAWMQILAQVPDSALWLLDDNPWATAHLRARAEIHRIARERLVFAPRIGQKEHLQRHAAADVALDTAPYGAHTTASDALWAGVPVVTCPGQGFASRVAGSLLTAVGLQELITTTLAESVTLSVALGKDPPRLAALKRRLVAARADSPLFDTPRFCRHLEAAYRLMLDTWRGGSPARTFHVPRH